MSKLAIHNKFETALVPESALHKSDDPAFRRKRRDFHDTMDNGALRPWASSGVVYPTIHPCCDLLFPDVSNAESEMTTRRKSFSGIDHRVIRKSWP